MVEFLVALILSLIAGQASTPDAYPDRCAEDEYQVGAVCFHSEGDGWRVLPG